MNKTYKKLLIIEDDKFMQNRLKSILNDYEITVVSTAEEGIEAFHQLQSEPLLILLDIELPKMNGYDACRKIREIDNNDTPVMFLSAIDDLDDRIKGYEAGGDDYITKPFNAEELKSKVDKVLKNKELKDQLHQKIDDTSHAAITAQTIAAKMGEISQFLQDSRFFRDIPSLCERFFKVTRIFGLSCSVRIDTKKEILNFSDDNIINPLEKMILEKALNAGRIYHFGEGRAIFNWGAISLLIKNLGDEADTAASLMNGFESSVEALLIEQEFVTAIHQLKKDNVELQEGILKKYDQLSTELSETFINLGITSSLSDYELEQVTEILERNKNAIRGFFQVYKKNDEQFAAILASLEQSYQQNTDSTDDKSILF